VKNGSYLPPRLIQGVGIILLVGSAIFWAYTGSESILFVSAALSLIGIGTVQGIRITLSQDATKNNNLDKEVKKDE
jgi:hypothetical protein